LQPNDAFLSYNIQFVYEYYRIVNLTASLFGNMKKMSNLPCVGLFQILSDKLLPNISWIGLQLEKLSQKWKGELFIETKCTVV